MTFSVLPNWLLMRLISDQQARLHWNVILSHVLLAVFVISPLLALANALPHTCLVRGILGIPCPGCGITTSVMHVSHGDWHAATTANFAGVVLVVGMVLQVVIHGLALRAPAFDRRSWAISGWLNFLTLSSIAVSWCLRLSHVTSY